MLSPASLFLCYHCLFNISSNAKVMWQEWDVRMNHSCLMWTVAFARRKLLIIPVLILEPKIKFCPVHYHLQFTLKINTFNGYSELYSTSSDDIFPGVSTLTTFYQHSVEGMWCSRTPQNGFVTAMRIIIFNICVPQSFIFIWNYSSTTPLKWEFN